MLDCGDGETSHEHVKGTKVDRDGEISRGLMAQIYAGDPDTLTLTLLLTRLLTLSYYGNPNPNAKPYTLTLTLTLSPRP